MGWWSDAWNWVKKTAKKVWNGIKKVWNVIGPIVKTTLDVLGCIPGVVGTVATIISGVILVVEGIAYVVKSVKNGNVEMVKKKRLLGVGLALIATHNCSKVTFDDALRVLSETRGLLTFMVASNFTNGKEICDNMLPAYEYSEYYIESCYIDDENILKDTGKMLKDSYNLISRFCQDEQYRVEFSNRNRCQSQPRKLCIERHKALLNKKGLLLSNDEGQTRAITEYSPDIKTTCSAIEKVNSCAKRQMKSLTNCPPDQYQELEETVATDFDAFCQKHRNWNPAAKGNSGKTNNKKDPGKNSTASAAIMSRMSMLSYVAIVAIRAA